MRRTGKSDYRQLFGEVRAVTGGKMEQRFCFFKDGRNNTMFVRRGEKPSEEGKIIMVGGG